jgi:4-hydroxybenzoate polyprenyltransferase
MIQQIRHILEMIRFSHTVFALPFAMLAALMAWTAPSQPPIQFRWRDLLGILLCMVCARSAAMAFNRLADRKIDAGNPRTANRHLPAGIISPGRAILFTVVMAVCFVVSTLLFLPNTLPLFLSLPVLAFIGAYSFTKRFTSLAHFWLGASLFLAPVSAWIAIRGGILMQWPVDILPALWLGTAVLLWVSGFDIIYACQDVDFDQQARLKSVPAAVGIERALTISAVCHLLMIPVLFTLPLVSRLGGPPLELGWIYSAGVMLVAMLLIYEHWLVQPDDLSRVQVAFFHVNAVVSIGLLVIVAVDVLLV